METTSMKRLFLILDFVALAAVLYVPSFAATEYVVVNNGNYVSNSATLYRLNSKSGKLLKAAVLDTGGQASMFADNLAQV
jgi:hypothetical protein